MLQISQGVRQLFSVPNYSNGVSREKNASLFSFARVSRGWGNLLNFQQGGEWEGGQKSSLVSEWKASLSHPQPPSAARVMNLCLLSEILFHFKFLRIRRAQTRQEGDDFVQNEIYLVKVFPFYSQRRVLQMSRSPSSYRNSLSCLMVGDK